MNPDFFKGTAIADDVERLLASHAPQATNG